MATTRVPTRRQALGGLIALLALSAAGLAGCRIVGGPLTGGRLELVCQDSGQWRIWHRPVGATHVYVSVVNASVETPLDLIVEPTSPPFVTTATVGPPGWRVWDGHGSTGVIDLPTNGDFYLVIATTDGSEMPGEVSVLVNAVDADGQAIVMGCPSPSPG